MAVANVFIKLVDGKRGRIIASRAFESSTPTSGTDPKQMVSSLNQAFDAMLREVVPWVAKNKPKAEA